MLSETSISKAKKTSTPKLKLTQITPSIPVDLNSQKDYSFNDVSAHDPVNDKAGKDTSSSRSNSSSKTDHSGMDIVYKRIFL